MRISAASWWLGIFIGFISLGLGNALWSTLGLTLVAVVLSDFVRKIGNSFPVLELIVLVAVFQLILGPWFAYRLPASFERYRMYVPEEQYMEIAVPALAMLLLGMSVVRPAFNIVTLRQKLVALGVRFPQVARNIIFLGIAASLTQRFFPPSLGFLFYLTSNLIYIGALLYYLSPAKPYRLLVYGTSMGYALLQAAGSGLFHDFLLWLALGLPLIAINLRLSMALKVGGLVLGILLIMALQQIKQDFRGAIGTRVLSRTESALLLGQMIQNTLVHPEGVFTPINLAALNVRLNQGWITSAIFVHVPAVEPFANGQTLVESIEAALLPRVLFPDKKVAGGRENFRRYTGIPIGENTSMGIGLLGEAYINFGKFAGVLMLVWGYLLVRVFAYLLRRSQETDVLLFFFIPLIFLHVVKAETEFLIVLNHLLKSIIFTLGLYFLWFSRFSERTKIQYRRAI